MNKILIVFVLLFFISFISACSYKKFDQKVWLEYSDWSKSAVKNPRMNMIDDLSNNYLKVGMPKSEVIRLLGDNYECQKDDTITSEYKNACKYQIGEDFTGDVDSFVIFFDENDNVIKFHYVPG